MGRVDGKEAPKEKPAETEARAKPAGPQYYRHYNGNIEPVDAKKVDIVPWADTAVYKDKATNRWVVIEARTGRSAGGGDTRKAAVKLATENFERIGEAMRELQKAA